jgi:predicted nuclease of predicted toxin-antitoxin system
VPIRFHLDEHISAHIAAGLRRRNIDVTTAAEAGLIGATDVAHLEFAVSSGRVVVTQDDDFLRLHAQGVNHAGITLSPEEMAGRVEFL